MIDGILKRLSEDHVAVLVLLAGAAVWLVCSLLFSQKGWLNKKLFLGFWLLFLSGLVRVLVYSKLPSPDAVPPNWTLYFEALRKHFFEYIYFTTLKPPLSHLINALPLWLFGPVMTYESRYFLIIAFLLDTLAVWLVYLAAKNLKIRDGLAFIIALFYSMAIIPLELWRNGLMYDHHTIFFTALFIYACCRMLNSQKLNNLLFVSVSGALLLWQSTANVAVVPVTAGAAILLTLKKDSFKFLRLLKKGGIVLGGPILAAALLIGKNYLVSGTPTTSNGLGPGVMMIVQRALEYQIDKVRTLAIESGVPDWWLWCYDHPTAPTDPDGKPYPNWEYVPMVYGYCTPWTKLSDASWPFDFSPLYKYLFETGQLKLAKIVEKDMNDMQKRKYLFAGYSPETCQRWISQYGNESVKLYKRLLMKNRRRYIWAVKQIYEIYVLKGSKFLSRLTTELRTEPIPAQQTFLAITKIFGAFMLISYISVFLCFGMFIFNVIVLLFLFIVLAIIKKRRNVRTWLLPMRAFVLLSIPIILSSIIFTITVGGENDRYLLQSTPYLVLIVGYFLSQIRRLVIKLRRKGEQGS
jgi:hypothetical protein